MNQLVELLVGIFLRRHVGAETDFAGILLDALFDNLFNADERAADDKQNVARVDFDCRSFGVLALTAFGEFDFAAFQHFQETLLNALMTGIGGD